MPITRTLPNNPTLADVARVRSEFEQINGPTDLFFRGAVYDRTEDTRYDFKGPLVVERLLPRQRKLIVPLLDGFYSWAVEPVGSYSFELVARDARPPATQRAIEEEKMWPEWTALLRPYAEASRLADIDAVLQKLSFKPAVAAPTESSVAALFRAKTRRCGIYVLHFANGEHYVGQTVEITRRFPQHRKRHADIARISFRPVGKRSLDAHEALLIQLLERRRLRLRNIDMTSILASEPGDFDELMPVEQQQRWLKDPSFLDLAGERVEVMQSDKIYDERYRILKQLPEYDAVFPVVRAYVRNALPAVLRAEASYWQASVLPGNADVLVRVNANWQEVFVAYRAEDEVYFYAVLSKRELQQVFGDDLVAFERRFPGAEWSEVAYRAGGVDQIAVLLCDRETALRFFNDRDVLTALRQYNLRLMKKGKCPWGRSHNFDLVTDILHDEARRPA